LKKKEKQKNSKNSENNIISAEGAKVLHTMVFMDVEYSTLQMYEEF
jgi:hypothetical protein